MNSVHSNGNRILKIKILTEMKRKTSVLGKHKISYENKNS